MEKLFPKEGYYFHFEIRGEERGAAPAALLCECIPSSGRI